jgi:hypothetical protein
MERRAGKQAFTRIPRREYSSSLIRDGFRRVRNGSTIFPTFFDASSNRGGRFINANDVDPLD